MLRNDIREAEEIIPDKLNYQGESKANLVLKTKTTQAVPTSGGTSYGGGSFSRDVVFKINSEHFLSLEDLCLVFQLKTEQDYLIPDDLCPVVSRIQCRVNDVIIDDINNVSDMVKTMTYLTCPQGYYKSQLHSMSGATRYVPSHRYSDRSVPHNQGVGWTMQQHDSPIYGTENYNFQGHSDNGKNLYCLPLNYLSLTRGSYGGCKLWPARFAGSIELVITFADWQDCMVIQSAGTHADDGTFTAGTIYRPPGSGTAGATDYAVDYGYQVVSPKLLYKTVELRPEYYDHFGELVRNGVGFKYFHNAYRCITKQISNGMQSSHDISFSISSKDLRAVYVAFFPRVAHKEFHVRQSYFGDLFKSCYLTAGSDVYPANHVNGLMEAWWGLRDALGGDLQYVTAGGVLDMDEWSGRRAPYGYN